MSMSSRFATPAWINDGEKFGLVSLSVKLDGDIAPRMLTRHFLALTTTFAIPPLWRDWLGSIRADELDDCNLFLLSKLPSLTPGVHDAENHTLRQRVWNFYVGLLLASTFSPAHKPVMLTGARQNGDINIREQTDLDCPVPSLFRFYPPVVAADIRRAAQLAENMEALAAAFPAPKCWRLNRVLHLYTEARSSPDPLERIHQYCRCIEGLILPTTGQTKRQFKSRTELFIGPRHHDLMDELYDLRSAVEHLHENRYLESFDREIRLDLVQKEAIAEHIARTALARIIGCKPLWSRFANTSALAQFWGLTGTDRQLIWGDPIDPLDALADYDPKYIPDGHLGGP
jgi:hypothetical protein